MRCLRLRRLRVSRCISGAGQKWTPRALAQEMIGLLRRVRARWCGGRTGLPAGSAPIADGEIAVAGPRRTAASGAAFGLSAVAHVTSAAAGRS